MRKHSHAATNTSSARDLTGLKALSGLKRLTSNLCNVWIEVQHVHCIKGLFPVV